VIYGTYTSAIDVRNTSGATAAFKIDNNSIFLTGASTGISLTSLSAACLRSNLITGTGAIANPRAYFLNGATFGAAGACGTLSSGNNIAQVATACGDTGGGINECAATNCGVNTGAHHLCETAIDPNFATTPQRENQCLVGASGSTGLANIGVDLGYDLNGTRGGSGSNGPPVGAHDSPGQFNYGGTAVPCP
jgi:hypothetical protein